MLTILFLLWAIAGAMALMIIRVDIRTFYNRPIMSVLLLMWLGPVGWLLIVFRVIQLKSLLVYYQTESRLEQALNPKNNTEKEI